MNSGKQPGNPISADGSKSSPTESYRDVLMSMTSIPHIHTSSLACRACYTAGMSMAMADHLSDDMGAMSLSSYEQGYAVMTRTLERRSTETKTEESEDHG